MAFAFIFTVCVFAVIAVSVGKGKSTQVKVEKLEFPDDKTQAPQEDASEQEYGPVAAGGPVEAYGPETAPQAGQESPVGTLSDTAAVPPAKVPVEPVGKAPAAAARTATTAAGRAARPDDASPGQQPAVDLGNDEEKRKLIIYSEILKPKFDR